MMFKKVNLRKLLAIAAVVALVCSACPMTAFSAQADSRFIYLLNVPQYGSDGNGVFSGVVYDGYGDPIPDPENYSIYAYLSIDGGESFWIKPYTDAQVTRVNPDCSWAVRTVTSPGDIYGNRFVFYLTEKSWSDENPQPERSAVMDAALDEVTVVREESAVSVTPAREVEIELPDYYWPEVTANKILVDIDLHTGEDAAEVLSEEYIRSYIDALIPYASGIRTYSATSEADVYALRYAKSKGLFTCAGAWISPNEADSLRECDALIALANEHVCDMALVGSEVLERHEMSADKLIGYVLYVKERIEDKRIATSTADTIGYFYALPELCAACDVLCPNLFGYWNGVDIAQCAKHVQDAVVGLTEQWPLTKSLISETGFPTLGDPCGLAVPSEENAAAYFSAVHAWAVSAELPIFWMQFADSAYKADPAVYGGVEGHWGFTDQSLVLKSAFSRVPFFQNNLIRYSVKNDVAGTKSATVTGLNGRAYCVDVPQTLGGYTVTTIQGSEWGYTPAFKDHNEVTEIRFPHTLIEIGDDALCDTAFYQNEDNWEDGVLYCGEYLIKANASAPDVLEVKAGTRLLANYSLYRSQSSAVVFCEGLIGIGYAAMEYSKAQTIELPDSVEFLQSWAWTKSAVKTFRSGAHLKQINGACFCDCYALTDVYIGPEVDYIASSAFEGCRKLERIEVDPGNPDYQSGKDGKSVIRNGDTLVVCLKDAEIPDGIAAIENNVFYEMSSLTDVALPQTLRSIGDYAFCGTGLKSLTIPDGVTKIGRYTFARCRSLTSVHLPDSLVTLGDNAFYGTGLTEVTVPGSVTYVQSGAFDNCPNLESVTVSDGVQRIGSRAFYGCKSLTRVTIPDSVTQIDADAFAGCGEALTIISGSGSAAQAYALANNIAFAASDNPQPPTLYTVRFVSDGAVTAEIRLAAGAQIVKPDDPQKADCTFVGWDPEVPQTMPAQDVTFTAVFAASENAQICVEPTVAYAGKTTDVCIKMQHNPGVVAMRLEIAYDSSVLTLVSAQNGSVLGGTFTTSQSMQADPFVAMWNDSLAAQDYDADGDLLVLTFMVSDTAEAGTTTITVTYSNTYNKDLEPVALTVRDANATILKRISGDANNDGRIDLRDAVIILRFLARWDGCTVDESSADVDGDGVVALKDVVLIERFLAGGWNVTLI